MRRGRAVSVHWQREQKARQTLAWLSRKAATIMSSAADNEREERFKHLLQPIRCPRTRRGVEAVLSQRRVAVRVPLLVAIVVSSTCTAGLHGVFGGVSFSDFSTNCFGWREGQRGVRLNREHYLGLEEGPCVSGSCVPYAPVSYHS